MTNYGKTLEVGLDQSGFCIATGPQDSGIVYTCPANPFAPVLLKSPVVLHLHCPDLFPNEVLKVHAEHLGHFLALQSVPRINQEVEQTLFLGLCKLFTRDKVLSLYKETLTDEALHQHILDTSDDQGGSDSYTSVFVTFHKAKAGPIVSLLRKLLGLFDVADLVNNDVMYKHGEEPAHMLFLYLIQLLAIFVSSCIDEKDLATIMSVASAPFLEANFCDPLCAATLLKPMFIPFFNWQGGSNPRRGETGAAECQDPDAFLIHYRLFTGYELDKDGSDVSYGMTLGWTDTRILERIQACRIVEGKHKMLWFVAPQMGDRMVMVKEAGLRMMGGQTDHKALKICSYLMSDNVMAYMQCAVFGTIGNMLPCAANSDFTETVMTVIERSMARFSDAVRHQSANLKTKLSKIPDSCLYTTGVGFSGQDKGKVLYFGKVFTGPDDKRPSPPLGAPSIKGTFASVTLGIADNTMMNNMLAIALQDPKRTHSGSLQSMLSRGHKSIGVKKKSTDGFLYARFHHRFNTGEFTEVANVKGMRDPTFNASVHKGSLSDATDYRLIVSHGALPMCTLTLAMTIRQTVMMVMGLFCAELARLVYSPKGHDAALCKHLISLFMAPKFRHGKDKESGGNAFDASYGNSIKLTGKAFSKPDIMGINYTQLDTMEWLQADDTNLPAYLRRSLEMIGDTKNEVAKIMKESSLSYNRVLFWGETGVLKFATAFANQEFMIHAPMMQKVTMRTFNTLNKNYGCVKLCRQGCHYHVRVFSNECVDTKLFSSQRGTDLACLTGEKTSSIDDLVGKIKSSVSCVLPRIDVNRIKVMNPGLNETEFESLVSAVKRNNIEVTGEEDVRGDRRQRGQTSEGNHHVSSDPQLHGAGEEPHASPEKKRAKLDCGLTMCNSDVDFGFDDSD